MSGSARLGDRARWVIVPAAFGRSSIGPSTCSRLLQWLRHPDRILHLPLEHVSAVDVSGAGRHEAVNLGRNWARRRHG